MAVAVVGVSTAPVTAVVVGTGCSGGVVAGLARGLHPERFNRMMKQMIMGICLAILFQFLKCWQAVATPFEQNSRIALAKHEYIRFAAEDIQANLFLNG